MNFSFKQELIIGFFSIIIISALIVFRAISYENQSAQFSPSTTSISTTPKDQNTQTAALTNEEILKHSSPNDCWIIIEQKVYSVTDYLSKHPGGAGRISAYCGKDATQAFLTQDGKGSHSAEAFRILGILYVGDVNGTVMKQPDTKAVQSIPVNNEKEEEYED
jgi:cytochrome b involved in lipid metabolism